MLPPLRDPPPETSIPARRRREAGPGADRIADRRDRAVRSTSGSPAAEDGADVFSPVQPDSFLVEVDQLRGELACRVPKATAPPGGSHDHVGPPADEGFPVESDRWGKASPYLEERVNLAQTAASRLSKESSALSLGVDSLRRDLHSLDSELARISEELGFLRSSDEESAPWDEGRELGSALPGHRTEEGRESSPFPPSGTGTEPGHTGEEGPTGSFSDFTLARYNRTVKDLHARRRWLFWGTVGLAALISGILLFLTLRANEPVPPVWLAFLPLVWMVPVPFFVAAFRGTHRVLGRNQLDLPEKL